jgi:hypothetical protein
MPRGLQGKGEADFSFERRGDGFCSSTLLHADSCRLDFLSGLIRVVLRCVFALVDDAIPSEITLADDARTVAS